MLVSIKRIMIAEGTNPFITIFLHHIVKRMTRNSSRLFVWNGALLIDLIL